MSKEERQTAKRFADNNTKHLSATVPKETSSECHMIYKHFETQFVGFFFSSSLAKGFDALMLSKRASERAVLRGDGNENNSGK